MADLNSIYKIILTLSTIRPAYLKLHSLKNESAPVVLNEDWVKRFLRTEFEYAESKSCREEAIREWDHLVDIDDKAKGEASVILEGGEGTKGGEGGQLPRLQLNIKATLAGAKLDRMYWDMYFRNVIPSDFKDAGLRRQVAKLSRLGNSALNEDDLAEFTRVTNEMTEIYSTAKICPFTSQDCDLEKEGLQLEPDLIDRMAKPGLYEEHQYIWATWRDATGAKMKKLFSHYVDLSNQAAQANGFPDKGALWRSDYESEDFVQDMKNLWLQVRPLYDQLHAYVLHQLKQKYQEEITWNETMIPAHILGNMWAQSWLNIAPLVMPYPLENRVDLNALFKKKKWTVLKMFRTADEFYKSLGLESNEMCYNVTKGAMIEKPSNGRNVVCHASAWDFCDRKDFRIKMCTEVNFENFVVIHHEMGHIQYYQQYKNQPYAFRTGANPGFHEAIGDTIALSVSTPSHLYRMGLLDKLETSDEAAINSLMNMALERVAFLPFGYIVDKWRWDVFQGNVSYEEWNRHWWMYRETIQKVKAPVERNDERDFDPGAKFHVASDSQYISYFFAHLLEFQLHRALCIAADEYDPKKPKKKPLHACDIYKSKAAGKKLRKGLVLGASVHWKVVLKKMTGETFLSGRALLEYFQPLFDFLVEANSEFTETPYELNMLD